MLNFKMLKLFILLTISCLTISEAARILAVFPAPSLSHQLFFRPFTEELLKRGHEVVVITTDPAYTNSEPPANLREIDVHNVSYPIYRAVFCRNLKGNNDMHMQFQTMLDALTEVFESQYTSEPIQKFLNEDQKFDLVISEAYYRIAVAFGRIFNAPLMLLSSFGMFITGGEIIGSPVHPLYPNTIRQRVVNLTFWEQMRELYNDYWVHRRVYEHEAVENKLLKKLVPNAPTMWDAFNNVQMLMLNAYPPWEWNRPVPPGVVFLGPHIQSTKKELPEDLKTYLDNSKNGFIYISFGTNVIEALLPAQRIQIFNKVFSELPYNVVWKWSSNQTQPTPKNVKLVKWLPQPELLKHPNIKLFITHGGLHSTYEAIDAEVPMIGMPMSLDQWFQTEHYGHNGIGIRLLFESVTEELLKKTIQEVIENDSYRRSVSRLRSLTYDQPQTPMERFVWWTEHVLRHRGAEHLRAPAANMYWAEILELELVLTVVASILIFVSLSLYILTKIAKYARSLLFK